ncbi:MAG: metallophosphatase [Citromicrobium sp.]|nr:MAG: metallophosphatase [Citromicrobium sp.]
MKLLLMLMTGAMLGSVMPAMAHEGAHTPAQVPWQEASTWPDRIVATMERDPASSISVSWRTSAEIKATRAEITLALPDARFDQLARSVDAQTQLLDLDQVVHEGLVLPVTHNAGLPATSHHSVRFDGLEPDTLYAYRVQGAEGQWSEWFQTRTAPSSGPLRFIYLGDAQNGLDSHWPRVIRAAFQQAPDARFILHAGDLVNRGSRDLEWAHWFRAGSFINGMIPAIPVSGNHEYDSYKLGEEQKQKLLSILWRPQFRLPEEPELPDEIQETVYSVRYSNDLEVFVLNSNVSDMSEQAEWLDSGLAASDARWRIVTMHHPVFSSGRERDNRSRREVLLPVLLKHSVDLVLQGHDHTYARGQVGEREVDLEMTPNRSAAVDEGTVTTMFVNSVSGPKQYEFSATGWDAYAPNGVALARRGENTQFFQVIEIDGDQLTYAAYTADGALYDEVDLMKSANGTKSIQPSENTLPEQRLFQNTLPYESVK